MKVNKILLCGLIIFLTFFSTACHKPNTIILFNTAPITKENMLNNATEFVAGKRIYYIFITEKPLTCQYIRVRIIKRDDKAQNQAIKMFYSNDFRLNKDQIYYYNDYIVMNESGNYCMIVYARDKLSIPLAVADFKVK